MGVMDFIFRRAQEVKESASSRVVMQNPGRAVWTPRDFSAFAQEGYKRNVVAYQAINRIADAVASINWVVAMGGEEQESHPVNDILRRPNPAQSGPEFIRESIGYLMISGNCFIERVIVRNEVREMYALRPDRMKIVDGPNWPWPSGYEYNVGAKKIRWPVDDKTGQSDIRHLRLFNPLDDWYGQSPLEAGGMSVDQHNESLSWMQSLLQNSARPSGAMVYKAPDGFPPALSDDQVNRLKAQIDDQYKGAANAGRPMLLDGGLDWKTMGLSPSEVSLIETKNSAARDITLALGVPPQLLGIPGDNTYSNYQEARLAFWEDTVLPLAGYVSREMASWMGGLYGDIEIHPDLDRVPAIADKRAALWAMADASKDLTINERRRLKGLPDVAGGSFMPEYGFDTEGGGGNAPGDVQQMALNGGQIASVQSIVQGVADGMMPADSAIRLLQLAIPAIDEATARAIIDPASGFTPAIDFTQGTGDAA